MTRRRRFQALDHVDPAWLGSHVLAATADIPPVSDSWPKPRQGTGRLWRQKDSLAYQTIFTFAAVPHSSPPRHTLQKFCGPPKRRQPRRPKIPDVFTRFEHVLWNLVVRFSHRSITAETVRATGHSLPPASWALLDQLDHGGPMRVSDIAACHGVDVSSVTPRLQSLEAEGLIERSRHEHDGRVSVIGIGESGREALRRMHAARAALISDALSAEDRAQLTHLVPVLERISQSLQVTPSGSPVDH